MATQTQVLDAPVAARKSSGLWRDAFGRLAKNRLALVGLFLVALFAFVAIFGPWLAPYDYKQQDVAATAPYNGPIPPMTDGHVLGTDQLGRTCSAASWTGRRSASRWPSWSRSWC